MIRIGESTVDTSTVNNTKKVVKKQVKKRSINKSKTGIADIRPESRKKPSYRPYVAGFLIVITLLLLVVLFRNLKGRDKEDGEEEEDSSINWEGYFDKRRNDDE